MAKYGVEKIWHLFLKTTEKMGTTFLDCGTSRIDREWGLLFPMAFGWLLFVPGGLGPAESIRAEQTAWAQQKMGMPRALTMTA